MQTLKNYTDYISTIELNDIQKQRYKVTEKILDLEWNQFKNGTYVLEKSIPIEILDAEWNDFIKEELFESIFDDLNDINELDIDYKIKNILYIIFNLVSTDLITSNSIRDTIKEFYIAKKLNFKIKDLHILITELHKNYQFSSLFDKKIIKSAILKANAKYIKYLASGFEGEVFEITEHLVVKIINCKSSKQYFANLIDKLSNTKISNVSSIYKSFFIDNFLFVVMEKLKPLSFKLKNDIDKIVSLQDIEFPNTSIKTERLTELFKLVKHKKMIELANFKDLVIKNKLNVSLFNSIVAIFSSLTEYGIFNSDIKSDSFMLNNFNELVLIDIVSNYTEID